MRNFATQLALATALIALPAVTLCAQDTTNNQRQQINDRSHDEQGRIQQGERSGQITRGEAANLEAHQHAINTQARVDRAAHHGRLTARERRQIARKQNRQSARINHDKHNANTSYPR